MIFKINDTCSIYINKKYIRDYILDDITLILNYFNNGNSLGHLKEFNERSEYLNDKFEYNRLSIDWIVHSQNVVGHNISLHKSTRFQGMQ